MLNPLIGQSQLPKLPRLEDLIGSGPTQQTPDTIFKLLRAPQARLTDLFPQIEGLLIGNQSPALRAIDEGSRQNAAIAQSEAMKRGLTGSDIELANIRGARESGILAQGQLLAQQSSALAQFLMQALGLDIQANREQFVTLAQAIGQELAGQRDLEIARRQMEFAASEGGRNSGSSLLGSLIGASGSLLGGALTGGGYAGGLGNLFRFRRD